MSLPLSSNFFTESQLTLGGRGRGRGRGGGGVGGREGGEGRGEVVGGGCDAMFYGQTLPIDGKTSTKGWAKLSRKRRSSGVGNSYSPVMV